MQLASIYLKHTNATEMISLNGQLAYLPHKRRDSSLDEENIELYISGNGNVETSNDILKDEKKIKKPGLLNWLKLRKRDNLSRALTSTSDKSSGVKSINPLSTPPGNHNPRIESIHSHSAEFLLEPKLDQQTDDDNSLSHETPPSVNEQEAQLNEKAFELEGSMKTLDQIDSLREQENVLSGEVAIHLSTVKRLSDETTRDTNNEFPSSVSELEAQLNEKSFELEVKTTENRVIQEQLNQKINECEGLQETIASLKQLLSDAQRKPHTENEVAKTEETDDVLLRQAQAYEIEELKQKVSELTESKDQLEARNRKLANDSSYAKGLASAAAVELTALAEELAKLMNQNERLTAELAAAATPKHSPIQRKTPTGPTRNGRNTRPKEQSPTQMELKRELALSREREMSYEAMISKKDKKETELQQRLDKSKQREAYLENELANMWVLVAKLKRPQGEESEPSESSRESQRVDGWDLISCRSPTGL